MECTSGTKQRLQKKELFRIEKKNETYENENDEKRRNIQKKKKNK